MIEAMFKRVFSIMKSNYENRWKSIFLMRAIIEPVFRQFCCEIIRYE